MGIRLSSAEEHNHELEAVTTQMAEKLEKFRNGILYEIVHQLQLPVDEEEAGAITKKISLSGRNMMAIWSEVLQTANNIDPAKFVQKVRRKVKDAHELTRRWQKEYKELKGNVSRSYMYTSCLPVS